MGQAISTLVFEKKLIPKGVFFPFSFLFSILKAFEITYTGSSRINKHSLHIKCLFLELGKLKEPTKQHNLFMKKMKVLFHRIRLHENCELMVGCLNDQWLFFFLAAYNGMWKFSGQELNPYHSRNPGCCNDNTGSFTCWATRGLSNDTFF